MREYFTFGKLHSHLRYSAPCRLGLQQRGFQCIPQAGHGSVINSVQEHRHDRLLPPLPSQGPQLPPPRARDVEDFHVDLYGALTEALLGNDDVGPKKDRIMMVLTQIPTSWTQFLHTLDCLQQYVQPHDLSAFSLSDLSFNQLIAELRVPESWPCFQHAYQMPAPENTISDLEWQCDNMTPTSPCSPKPIRGFGVHRFILHAFSGRRRAGDFQFFLDQITQTNPGIVIHTLSVDILLDSHWGDVSDVNVQNFWIHAARQRWVVGFLGGPPCETWSRAREQTLDTKDRMGPRVVRTIDEAWGKASLSLREMRQVLIGNQLMWFSIMMMVVLFDTGGCGALEHPAEPPKATSVSIWRTPILQMLLRLDAFRLWEFAQGLLGAVSAKPTMMLTLRLPDFGVQIRQWRVVDDLPKVASIGQGSDGKFNTMVLKEYPPALCGAIASSFRCSLESFPIDAGVQIPCEFFETCASMLVEQFGTELGPDFAGGAL